jgi:hypothetical protein
VTGLPCPDPAPLRGTPDPAAPGYVVVFRDGTDVDAALAGLAREPGVEPHHVYRSALLGFSATLEPAALAAVRCHPAVDYVEHDAPVRMM